MKVLNEQDRLFRSRLTTLFVFFFNRYYEYLLVLLASHDLIYIYNDAVVTGHSLLWQQKQGTLLFIVILGRFKAVHLAG